jgi:transcriptional regulator with XRE-family HTH domain
VNAASILVRAARKSQRLTQQQLADRAHVDQGRVSRSENGREAEFSTIERLLAGAGHRLYSAPTRRDDAATVATEIRQHLRANENDRALRALLQLNDNLVAERGLVRGILGLAEPESTRDEVWDAAIAGLVAWRLREEGLPLPEWTLSPRRYLSPPRALDVDPADPTPPPPKCRMSWPNAVCWHGATPSRASEHGNISGSSGHPWRRRHHRGRGRSLRRVLPRRRTQRPSSGHGDPHPCWRTHARCGVTWIHRSLDPSTAMVDVPGPEARLFPALLSFMPTKHERLGVGL